MAAKWDDTNMACKATWTILSAWLNQIKPPIDPSKAATIKMSDLRFWVQLIIDDPVKHASAMFLAFQFLLLVQDNYAVTREDSAQGMTSKDMVEALCKVFETADATLADLAAKLDAMVRFAGEAKKGNK